MNYKDWKELEDEVREIIAHNIKNDDSDSWTEIARLILEHIEDAMALIIAVESLQNKIAAATAHRVCCGVEADVVNGKIHGYCVVCGVPWPCETARAFIFSPSKEAE